MRTVHFMGGPLNGARHPVDGAARVFQAVAPKPDAFPGPRNHCVPVDYFNYQIHALVHGAHVHHVATLPGSPDPIAQLLAAYFKE